MTRRLDGAVSASPSERAESPSRRRCVEPAGHQRRRVSELVEPALGDQPRDAGSAHPGRRRRVEVRTARVDDRCVDQRPDRAAAGRSPDGGGQEEQVAALRQTGGRRRWATRRDHDDDARGQQQSLVAGRRSPGRLMAAVLIGGPRTAAAPGARPNAPSRMRRSSWRSIPGQGRCPGAQTRRRPPPPRRCRPLPHRRSSPPDVFPLSPDAGNGVLPLAYTRNPY